MIDILYCINCFMTQERRHKLCLLDSDTYVHANSVYYSTFKEETNIVYLGCKLKMNNLCRLLSQPWFNMAYLASDVAMVAIRRNIKHVFHEAFCFIHSGTEVRSLFNVSIAVGNFHIFHFLVDHPAIQEEELTQGFQQTCHNGNVEIARALVDKEGTDLHFNNCIGLKWACLYGYLPIVRMLLKKGLDPTVGDNVCIIWAAQRGHMAVIKYLLTFRHVNPAVNNNEPLRQAERYGKRDMVAFLLSLPKVQHCHRSSTGASIFPLRLHE